MKRRQIKKVGILMASLVLATGPAQGYQREVQQAADTLAEKLAVSGKQSIAVVDFTDLQGNVTELGRFLAEELSVALASGNRPIEVVDRTHLKVLIQEHKLSASGLLDPATAKKLGQIAGVDVLATGTLTDFGETVRISIKALDASTARVVAAATAEIAKTARIADLDKQGLRVVAAPPQATQREAPQPSAMPEPIESGGLRFTLKRCTNTGGGVRCELLVENLTEMTTQLFFYASAESLLYDVGGNQYDDAAVSLGTSASSGRYASQNLLPGVPLAAKIAFSGVPNGVREGTLSLRFRQIPPDSGLSRLHGFAGQGGNLNIVFRRVPLT